MKIAAAVILFHPDNSCLANIHTYYDYVQKLYIFDNTETENNFSDELQSLTKIEYYQDGVNMGLSKRLNEACSLAIRDGLDWLLTMDQDSSFPEGDFIKYLGCANQFTAMDTVAMFGLTYERNNSSASPACQYAENIRLITSGSLLNLQTFKKIGSFDEALFIDLVDHDYCIRAIAAGYKTIQYNNILLSHNLGNTVYNASIKSLFLVKKKKVIHSPVRYYYMARNTFYLIKKFENQNLPHVGQLRADLNTRLKIAFFYSRNIRQIWKYVRLGYNDYKQNKMGRINDIHDSGPGR
jgi:rhamnosyltransferase